MPVVGSHRVAVAGSTGRKLRPNAGTMARFQQFDAHANRDAAALPANHPAIVEGRTLFSSTVAHPDDVERVLVSGYNSSKIGRTVMKGPWRGFPIYTLTLEERATCPSACELWKECYGNAMPFARRHAHGDALISRLGRELPEKARQHPRGFAVRAHVLGDFWSLGYAKQWLRWMVEIPQLHVWGYTAHSMQSDIGRWIDAGNDEWPDRWAFRFSVGHDVADRNYTASTIWRKVTTSKRSRGVGVSCLNRAGSRVRHLRALLVPGSGGQADCVSLGTGAGVRGQTGGCAY